MHDKYHISILILDKIDFKAKKDSKARSIRRVSRVTT